MTAVAEPEVTVRRDGPVATVELSNPGRRNALTGAMLAELSRVFPELDDDPEVRVVVVTGRGEDFCSGADLSAVDGDRHPLGSMNRTNRAALALHRMATPTVARVDGVAVGAGLNLALGCDLVVASDRARFSEVFVRRGLAVDFGGSWVLPRLIGMHRAKELCLLGEVLPASRAVEIGLVNRSVPVDELDATVDELTARLAAGPAVAMALTKRLLADGAGRSLPEALDAEAAAQAITLRGEDVEEAFGAFREKRDARFTERL
ncbi:MULTISPECIES: enoyl-CoA hydratase/isomerase family protein [unclassified Pseudonocardia]|uniref:enoyl-CoA hydratase/isomerase family protein n=1 Tax=unclassified Pseudonocardia TaxID=2619320 RepID=UPI001CF619AE|nr:MULTISPECIES: enoyl-CoA hydratase-related protein [unclassified Pseudonocardia]